MFKGVSTLDFQANPVKSRAQLGSRLTAPNEISPNLFVKVDHAQ